MYATSYKNATLLPRVVASSTEYGRLASSYPQNTPVSWASHLTIALREPFKVFASPFHIALDRPGWLIRTSWATSQTVTGLALPFFFSFLDPFRPLDRRNAKSAQFSQVFNPPSPHASLLLSLHFPNLIQPDPPILFQKKKKTHIYI